MESTRNAYMEIIKEDGILFCRFFDNIEMDEKIAELCVKERLNFSKGISYPAIIDMKGLKSVNKKAREFMQKEGSVLLKAGALLIGSPVSKVIGNIFLTLNTPEIPTKLFTSKEEALHWVKQFK
jgi:hypothetical protein